MLHMTVLVLTIKSVHIVFAKIEIIEIKKFYNRVDSLILRKRIQ